MKVLLFNSIGKILCLMVYSDYSVGTHFNESTHPSLFHYGICSTSLCTWFSKYTKDINCFENTHIQKNA